MERRITQIVSSLWLAGALAAADKPTPAQLNFFEEKIRPVLAAKCYKCHSERAQKVKGDLKLDSRAAILKGGEEGPSVTVGKPEESLLIHALRHQDGLEMPPKEKLPPAVVADFTRWIAEGAYFPSGGSAKAEQDWWEKVDRKKLLTAKQPIEQAVKKILSSAKSRPPALAPSASSAGETVSASEASQ